MASLKDRLKLFQQRLQELEDSSSEHESEEDDDRNPSLGAKYHNDTLALRRIKKLAIVEPRVVKSDLNSLTTLKEAQSCSMALPLNPQTINSVNESRLIPKPLTSLIKTERAEQSKLVENKIEEISICSKPSQYTNHMPTAGTSPKTVLEASPVIKDAQRFLSARSCSDEMTNKSPKNMQISISSSKSQEEINNYRPSKSGYVDSGRGSSLQSVESRETPSTSNPVLHQNIACQTAVPCSPLVFEGSRKRKKVFHVNGKDYLVLNVLGRGGSCVVFQVYSEQSKVCYAIKCVDLSDADDILIKAYKNEIWLLKSLQSSNRVVKMFDYEYVSDEQMLYVVMEKGDTDLATFFRNRTQNRLDHLTLAFYWSEMLKAVQVVHQKGIVHSDLKPRNFLLVGGQVKLIDFGIANAVPSNKTSVTKECQMGTPNYMSPEALSSFEDVDRCKFRVGVKSDVWSLGCILYYMVYGKTPFEHVPNNCKMFAITNCKYKIEFEPIEDLNLLNVMQRCLERDPRKRASVEELLNHPYLKKEPYEQKNTLLSLSDEKINDLAKLASKNTPKTNAKLLKKYFQN